MVFSQEKYAQTCDRIWTTIRRIDSSGVASLFGFLGVSFALAKTSLFLGLFIFIIGAVLVFFATENSFKQKSTALVDRYENIYFERMKRERKFAAEYLLDKR
jgi:hypothetical protein